MPDCTIGDSLVKHENDQKFNLRPPRRFGQAYMAIKSALATSLLFSTFLTSPASARAQDYTFTTNADGTLNLAQYTGPGGNVTVPGVNGGLTITSIGDSAFASNASLTSVTIPDTVTSIGNSAFASCYSLASITLPRNLTSIPDFTFEFCGNLAHVTIPTSVTNIGSFAFDACGFTGITIPDSVTSIGTGAFYLCYNLANVLIGNSVTNIGSSAFSYCFDLINLTIPGSVTSVGDYAFGSGNLTRIYFKGNAPVAGLSVFFDAEQVTVYYLPNTTNWGTTYGGQPTRLWNPQIQTSATLGVLSNQFGFNVTAASNLIVVVKACTNLAGPVWVPLQTNTPAGDSFYFSDPQWTNFPTRFYALTFP
jgi:BspA type Leucine rich repeat region (6 copies)